MEKPMSQLTWFFQMGVSNNTVLNQCVHSFCKRCIVSWIQINKMCPLSKKSLTEYLLFPNRIINDIIMEQKVKCLHANRGREWKDILCNLGGHLQRDCEFVKIKCRYIRCNDYEVRNLIETHKIIYEDQYLCSECLHCNNIFEMDAILVI